MIGRIALYAGGALAGVFVVSQLRPVKLDATAAVNAAGSGIDTALSDLFHGRLGAAADAFAGGAKSAGSAAQDQVQSQVRMIVVLGVLAGCSAAGVVDALVL